MLSYLVGLSKFIRLNDITLCGCVHLNKGTAILWTEGIKMQVYVGEIEREHDNVQVMALTLRKRMLLQSMECLNRIANIKDCCPVCQNLKLKRKPEEDQSVSRVGDLAASKNNAP